MSSVDHKRHESMRASDTSLSFAREPGSGGIGLGIRTNKTSSSLSRPVLVVLLAAGCPRQYMVTRQERGKPPPVVLLSCLTLLFGNFLDLDPFDHIPQLPVTLRITLADLHQILHAFDHFSEHCVAIVEMWSRRVGNEEL